MISMKKIKYRLKSSHSLIYFVWRVRRFLHDSDCYPFGNIRNYLRDKLWNRGNINNSKIFPGVLLETISVCNSRCLMCPIEKIMDSRKVKYMDEQIFTKVINECAEHGSGVTLANFGEPLLDPKIIDRIKYIKRQGLYVSIITNGSLMDFEMSNKLINSGIDLVAVSIDSIDKDVYESIRVGLKYDNVVNNITQLIKLRNSMNKSIPQVVLNYIDMSVNQGETSEFVKHWRNIVDYIMITTNSDRGRESTTDYGNISRNIFYKKRSPCYYLWKMVTVLPNGNVLPCCYDVYGELVLGNVKDNSVYEIYHGKIANEIRQIHLNGDLNSLKICKNCDAVYRPQIPWWWDGPPADYRIE